MKIVREREELCSLFSDIYPLGPISDYKAHGLSSGTVLLLCHKKLALPIPISLARECSPLLRQIIDEAPISPYEPVAISLPPDYSSDVVLYLYILLVQGESVVSSSLLKELKSLLSHLQISLCLTEEVVNGNSSNASSSPEKEISVASNITLDLSETTATDLSLIQHSSIQHKVEINDAGTEDDPYPNSAFVSAPGKTDFVLDVVSSTETVFEAIKDSNPKEKIEEPRHSHEEKEGSVTEDKALSHYRDLFKLKELSIKLKPLKDISAYFISDHSIQEMETESGEQSEGSILASQKVKESTDNFPCSLCSEVMPDLYSLKAHCILRHFSEKFYGEYTDSQHHSPDTVERCKLCTTFLGTPERLIVHIGIDHNKLGQFYDHKDFNMNNVGCDSMQVITQSNDAPSNFSRIHPHQGPKNILQCELCKYTTMIKNRLYKHYVYHYTDGIFEKFLGKSSCNREDRYDCPLCNKYSGIKRNIIIHVGMTHRKLGDFIEPGLFKFLTSSGVKRQNKIIKSQTNGISTHVIQAPPDNVSDATAEYHSNDSLSSNDSESSVNPVLNSSNFAARFKDTNKFRCNLCLYSTDKNIRFKNHYFISHYGGYIKEKYVNVMEESTGKRCRLCGYTSSNLYDVLRHVGRKHDKYIEVLPSDVFPLKSNSSSSDAMDSTEESATTSDLPLQSKKSGKRICHICEKTFLNALDLRRHYVTHYRGQLTQTYVGDTVGKPEKNQCTLCPYSGKLCHLVDHYAMVHNKLEQFLPAHIWQEIKKQHNRTAPVRPVNSNSNLGKPLSCHICSEDLASATSMRAHLGVRHFRRQLGRKFSHQHVDLVQFVCSICSKLVGTKCIDVAKHIAVNHDQLKLFIPNHVWHSIKGEPGVKRKRVNERKGKTKCFVTCVVVDDSKEIKNVEQNRESEKVEESVAMCPLCQNPFPNLNSLRIHVIDHFKNEICKDFNVELGKSIFKCKLCNFSTTIVNSTIIARHIGGDTHLKILDYISDEAKQLLQYSRIKEEGISENVSSVLENEDVTDNEVGADVKSTQDETVNENNSKKRYSLRLKN